MKGNSDGETNISHKLSLTNTQVANLHQAFANYLSTYTKLSKTQLSKMVQSGGFLARLIGLLLKTGLPLAKNVIQRLAQSVLTPLPFTEASAGMPKKS